MRADGSRGAVRRITLSQLRLGSKLPSLHNPLPSRERGLHCAMVES